MTRDEKRDIARVIKAVLPLDARERLKSIHVISRLCEGMLTIRCHLFPISPGDPDAEIFMSEELDA